MTISKSRTRTAGIESRLSCRLALASLQIGALSIYLCVPVFAGSVCVPNTLTEKIYSDPIIQQSLAHLFPSDTRHSTRNPVELAERAYVVVARNISISCKSGKDVRRGLDEMIGVLYNKRTIRALNSKSADQEIFRISVFVIRAYDLVRNSSRRDDWKAELRTLERAFLPFGAYLSEALARDANSIEPFLNQRLWASYILMRIGDITDTSTLYKTGTTLLVETLASQWENGVLPERGGFDTHYQSVSLTALVHIYMYEPNVARRSSVLNAMKRGYT